MTKDPAGAVVVNRSIMGEIQPGFWVGGLGALKEIPKFYLHRHNNDEPKNQTSSSSSQEHDDNHQHRNGTVLQPSWTIISLVQSPKLVYFTQTAVAELRQSHGLEVEHVLWEMADKANEPFLCERLIQVLNAMDEGMERRRIKPDNANGYQHDSREENSSCRQRQRQHHHHVLVHCAFGISRSVSVCAAWLLSRPQPPLTLNAALAQIRAVRPDAMPNMGFLANLRSIEQAKGDITQVIEQRKQRQRQLQQKEQEEQAQEQQEQKQEQQSSNLQPS
ncbi:hypothetical protein ACA910_015911 [Epithemia clementina (nom. ined.)]